MAKTRHSSIRRSVILGSFEVSAADAKGWPTPAALTSKNARRAARSARGLGALLGLMLTGCPTGADLDTSYEEYLPTPTTGVRPSTSSSDTSSTTSGGGPCDDSNVNQLAMSEWCGTPTCHGDTDLNNARAPLWLFSPTRSTDFLNLPATLERCNSHLLVNTTNPEESLLLTAIRFTTPAPCSLEMPENFPITDAAKQACIEEWVLGLATAGAGD